MALTMRADSTEFLTATITGDHDITGDTYEVAIPAVVDGVTPEPSTWYAATVVSVVANQTQTAWTATYQILVGPEGGVATLTAGVYAWLVRVTDSPEVPVRQAGTFTIV